MQKPPLATVPVDALYQCIYRLTGYDIVLDKFDLTAKGEGEDGLGQADIIANYKGENTTAPVFPPISLKRLDKLCCT